MENSNPALPEKMMSYFIKSGQPQEYDKWCLVACVQNLLAYYGMKRTSQSDIVKYYLFHTDNEDVVKRRKLSENRGPVNYFYSEFFKDGQEIYGISIPVIQQCVNSILREARFPLELKYMVDQRSIIIEHLQRLINKGHPTIVPFYIPSSKTVHINIVIKIKNSCALCFDPANRVLILRDLIAETSENNLQILYANECL